MDTGGSRSLESAIRNELGAELSRRQLIGRAGALGLGAVIAAAVPAAARIAVPAPARAADPSLLDGTLEAFFDTMIPGRRATRTELGNPIHPRAIAGVDPEPGGVEADALLLARNPKLGFATLEPVFLADLAARALLEGGLFIDLDYKARERVCLRGLDFSNPDRVIWEAAAALPFTAFCAAANIRNATYRNSVGYAVMGHRGTARKGYRDFSYRRKLNRGRTKRGSLK